MLKPASYEKARQVERQWSFGATDDSNPAPHIHQDRNWGTGEKHKKPSILLVEDNPADMLLIREAIEEHDINCELVVVSDGEQAINFIQQIESAAEICPSLIVLDLNLPKKSGREVLRRLRESSECNHVPVAILSSSDAQKDREEAARLGAIRYIRKPSNLDEFMKVGEILKGILLGFPN
jgi:CheY-like chemotaxis protein